jgi:hypothetical protein
MGVFLFLAFQTKPSYLFLIAFVSVGGWVARWWLKSECRDAWRVGLRCMIASVVPFIVWCVLRWTVVGHFGLVSFGGYNVIGIAGQLLEADQVQSLSEEVRPFAQQLLSKREEDRDWSKEADYDTMEKQFNKMVWQIAVPVASKLYDNDSREMNRQMTLLSSEIIKSNPKSYLRWIAMAAKRALVVSAELTVRNPVSILSIALILFAFGLRWHRRDRTALRLTDAASHAMEFQCIVWASIGYAVCKMALVILVEPPIGRYCAPAAVFLSSILSMAACEMLLRCGKHVHSSNRPVLSESTPS